MPCSDPDLEALALRLGDALLDRQASVATAESCTGGWIAKVLTDVAGSSRWFGAGIVSYSNRAKSELLGVPAALLAKHGAVSEPVVVAMAEGCLARTGADVAVGVSGIAGPDGGTAAKPVGTVWIAYGAEGRIETECCHFEGGREDVRRQTVERALVRLLALLASRG
jgi:nicotinamide-nucleotide amidase